MPRRRPGRWRRSGWPRPCRRPREVSSAPHGHVRLEVRGEPATRCRWCRRAATRRVILARAVGVRVLRAPSTLGASRPVTVRAGLAHSRSTTRAGADELDARGDARLGAQPLGGVVHVGGGDRCESPRRRGRRRSSYSVASRRHSAIRASGTRPPHMPECTAWVSVRTSTSTRTRPRRLVVSAGTPMSQLPLSAITMTSAAQRGRRAAASRSARVGEPTSSSPSMNIVTPTGEVVAERADRGQVRGDAGLVVGGAPAVEAAVALGGLEGRGVPVGVVVLGLHVVVGVEQHGRPARRRGACGRSRPGRRRRRGR